MACKRKCEVYSRIVGFYTPVQHWNKGKRAEYDARVAFQVGNEVEDFDKSARLRRTMAALKRQDTAEAARKEEAENYVTASGYGASVVGSQHQPSSPQAL